MNAWKLKWDLIDPHIQNFPKYGFPLTLLIVHGTFELVKNITIYKLFKNFLIISWYCKLLEFDFRILFEPKIIFQLVDISQFFRRFSFHSMFDTQDCFAKLNY